jgi:signal transduction histidine kinase/DNA-binding response OmpR family regulator
VTTVKTVTDAPAYRWTLLPETRAGHAALRLEGPLSRPRRRQRQYVISLAGSPKQVLAYFLDPEAIHDDAAGASESLHVQIGKRTIVLTKLSTAPSNASSTAAAGSGTPGGTHTDAAHAANLTGHLVDLSRLCRRVDQASDYAKAMEEGINALPEAFVLYDADDRLLIANPPYSDLYRTISDRVRPGVTFYEIAHTAVMRGQFHPSYNTAAWLEKRLAFHREGVGFFEQHLSDGRWFQVSERRTASGGIASIRADITLLKEREHALRLASEAAQATSRSISRFLAIFSHEVRNGLNGMAGIAQILAFNARAEGEHARSALLLESTRRLSTVLSDLLEYLKNEATEIAITHGDVDLFFLMDTIRAEFGQRATERGLTLVTHVEENVPRVIRGDMARIQQVMSNLVSNALKYSTQGQVTVTIAASGVRLRYIVRDEGIGIAAADVPDLFEFFARAAPDNPLSTGLGLAISKKLVTAMNGEIGLDSQLGHGSQFWFELPLQHVDRSTTLITAVGSAHGGGVPASAATVSPPSQPFRVGVIDDDLLNRSIAQDLLRKLEHTPHVFESGAALLAYLASRPLDALLLDLSMPRESGLQIAAQVRARSGDNYQRLAIIAATGNVLSDTHDQIHAAGIDTVMQKPLFLDTLDTVLRTTVMRRQEAPPQVEPHFAVLRDAIGERRFMQSMRAAERLLSLFDQAINQHAMAELPDIAHRVSGSAAQLGFGALAASARALESLLRSAPSGSSPHSLTDHAALIAQIRPQLAHAHQAIQDSMQPAPKPAGKRAQSRTFKR